MVLSLSTPSLMVTSGVRNRLTSAGMTSFSFYPYDVTEGSAACFGMILDWNTTFDNLIIMRSIYFLYLFIEVTGCVGFYGFLEDLND